MAKKKIKIPFSQEDLEDLLGGAVFDWTYNGVDVHLYMGYDDEDGTVCTKCGNSNTMYICKNCEDNQEMEGACGACGHMVELDEDYHTDCN